MKNASNELIAHKIVLSLTMYLVTVFSRSKTVMAGVSDPLCDIMSDIVDKTQQLAKDKIARMPITANQPMGPPMASTPVVQPVVQPMVQPVPSDRKPARKRTPAVIQQYANWDSQEYSSSKEGRQAQLDARQKLRQDM